MSDYSPARADGGGEAGIVIQHADGTVDTYCVAFQGDSISGAELLKRTKEAVVQFGGLVCAIGSQSRGEGCFQPSSVESCLCKSYPPDSTYWAFFTQQHGKSWVYSAAGFQQLAAKDGDLQAWKWGKGGPSSAPAPLAITFEQVCGHAPRGGSQPATATLAVATTTQPATPVAPAATVAASSGTATVNSIPNTSVVQEVTPIAPSPAASPSASFTIISHGTATAVPAAPATGSASSGGGPWSLVAFGIVAVALVVAIAGTLWWRRGHGR